MKTSYSLHAIDNDRDFSFDPDAYSRFKFGDGAAAQKFGTALADGFIENLLEENYSGQQLVVISSPYAFIPTATFAMKTWFVYRLNRWLVQYGFPVIQETKVHRTVTYKDDYGELNAEQRINLIGNDIFHVDKVFLEGKTLVFLDDIKITGSHERMILKMVNEYGLGNDLYLLYFAELVNKSIHPKFENHLNYHQVKTIFDLEAIIKGNNFIINTRTVKYILNHEADSFKVFIQNQSSSFLNLLYDMAIGNGYHTIEAYNNNLKFIEKSLLINNSNLIKHGN